MAATKKPSSKNSSAKHSPKRADPPPPPPTPTPSPGTQTNELGFNVFAVSTCDLTAQANTTVRFFAGGPPPNGQFLGAVNVSENRAEFTTTKIMQNAQGSIAAGATITLAAFDTSVYVNFSGTVGGSSGGGPVTNQQIAMFTIA